MRTTLDLPDPLFREVKTRAVQQGLTLKNLLAHYIEEGLRGQTLDAPQPRSRSPLPIAIPRVPGAPMTPALTNEQIHAILEEEDLAEYRRVLNPPKTSK